MLGIVEGILQCLVEKKKRRKPLTKKGAGYLAVLQEGGLLPGPESGLLSNTQK